MTEHSRDAKLYRMVMKDHICPFGLKSLDLLKRERYEVDDHWLTTRDETESFKAPHEVETTPQTFLGGAPIGGYDKFGRQLGQPGNDPGEVTHQTVTAEGTAA